MQGRPAPRALHEVVDDAASAGTIAHDMIDAHIKGKPYAAPNGVSADVLRRAQNAFEQATRWLRSTRTGIVIAEEPLVHEILHYGGTPDAVAMRDGNLVLLDYKTSNAIYSDYLLQLAAYDILLRHAKGMYCTTYEIIRFSKESGSFSHTSWTNIDVARNAGRVMLQMYNYDAQLKEMMK